MKPISEMLLLTLISLGVGNCSVKPTMMAYALKRCQNTYARRWKRLLGIIAISCEVERKVGVRIKYNCGRSRAYQVLITREEK